jgi:hypothetical protein
MIDGDTADGALAVRRPHGVGAVLDAALRLFRASLVGCLPYAAVAAAAGQLPTLYLAATRQPLIGFRSTDPLWWTLYVAETLLAFILWGGVLLRQQRMSRGLRLHAAEELAQACRRLPAVLWLAFPFAVALFLGTELASPVQRAVLLVPGVYLGVALSMSWPVLLIEGGGAASALRGSLRLVAGRWWRTATLLGAGLALLFVFYALGGLVGGVVSGVWGAVPRASLFAKPAVLPALTLLRGLSFLLLGALALPWLTAVLLAIYGELAARRDALPPALPGPSSRRTGA